GAGGQLTAGVDDAGHNAALHTGTDGAGDVNGLDQIHNNPPILSAKMTWRRSAGLLAGAGRDQPVLAFHQAGDHHGGDGVAGGVQAGGGGVKDEAQGRNNGEGLGREVEHANDQHLAHQAAARRTGQDKGREDGHHNGHTVGACAREIHPEDAVQEGDLDDGGQDRAVHVHGAAHGQHQVADVLGDADGVAGFFVDGDGGSGGLGGECGDGRREDVLDHGGHAQLAGGQEGVQGEEDDGVEQAQGVVDQHGPAVVADDLGAVGGHQVGKVGAQAQRGDGHDHADELHDDVVQVDEQLAHRGLVAAAGRHTEADEDGEDDEGQHVGLIPQVREVGHGQGADDQLGGGLGLAHLGAGHLDGGAGGGAEQVDPDQDTGGCDQAGEDEGADGAAQNAAQTLHVGHAAHGGGDGNKHQGHHDGEQQVQENIAHGFDRGAHAGG